VRVQILTVLLFFALWEAVGRSGIILKQLVPPPLTVIAEAWHQASSGLILPHLAASAHEVALGFGSGALLGLTLGLTVGPSRFLTRVVEPLLFYFGAVPKIIIYPIFILFLGVGLNSKAAVGGMSAFFPIAANTIIAVSQVSPTLVDAARSLGANPFQIATKVYLPSMISYIFAGLRLGLAVAIVGTLLAETTLAQQGLGLLAIDYFNNLRIAEMYAILLLIFIIAMALNGLMSALLSRLARFRARVEEQRFLL